MDNEANETVWIDYLGPELREAIRSHYWNSVEQLRAESEKRKSEIKSEEGEETTGEETTPDSEIPLA